MRIEMTNNIDKANKIRAALKKNNNYCPCQLEKNERTKCICLNFLESEDEWCHCGLYRKVND